MDFTTHNSAAWDKDDGELSGWKKPFSPETIAAARRGEATVLLTNTKPVPATWYMPVQGKKMLCLACGGGQQVPVFAAMGAHVTSFDISAGQLERDRMVAARENLQFETVRGDMRDLSAFADASFDLVFHPVSNCFIDDVRPVWRECARVLKPGGTLLSGFVNPVAYLFDLEEMEKGNLVVRYTIPYADTTQLPKDRLEKRIAKKDTLEFGHTLEDLIGGQAAAGFAITGLYEDIIHDPALDRHICSTMATKAIKL